MTKPAEECNHHKTNVVNGRYMLRKYIAGYEYCKDFLRQIRRKYRLQKLTGDPDPALLEEMQLATAEMHRFHGKVVEYGRLIMLELNNWQDSGATMDDLRNLCNQSYIKAYHLYRKSETRRFDWLAMFGIDDKFGHRKRGWWINAPLTYGAQEAAICMVHSDQTTRAYAEKAIMESLQLSFYTMSDLDGNIRLYDMQHNELKVWNR